MSFNRISDATLVKLAEKFFVVNSRVDESNVNYIFRPGGLSIVVNGEKPEEIPIASEFMDELVSVWNMYRLKAVG